VSNTLNKICFYFKRSTLAYCQYLNNGKTYQYARQLRTINQNTINLILSSKNSIPVELEDDFALVLNHLEVWAELWDKLNQTKIFKLNEPFIFQNKVSFPKESAKRIDNFYLKND
jgi:hypothetical protein